MICTATVEWTFGHKWTTSFNLEFSGRPVCNCIMFDFHQLAGSQLRAAHDGSYFSHTSKEGTAVMQQAWPDMASHFHFLGFMVSFGQLWWRSERSRRLFGSKMIQDTNTIQQQHISQWHLKPALRLLPGTEASERRCEARCPRRRSRSRPGDGLTVWLCLFYCRDDVVLECDGQGCYMVSRHFWGNSELKYVQVASLLWFIKHILNIIHQYFHVAAGEVETYHKLQRQDV